MTAVLTVIDPGHVDRATGAGRNCWAELCSEFLDHLRLDHDVVVSWPEPSRVDKAEGIGLVVLFVEPPALTPNQLEGLRAFVSRGGIAVSCGGVGDLSDLAGVADAEVTAEQHVRLDPSWWWAPRFPVALHAFGGRRLTLAPAADADAAGAGAAGAAGVGGVGGVGDVTVIGRADDGSAAIVSRSIGRGRVVVLGPDPWQSIGRIQQGWPIEGPGTPAPDGSAEIGADGILRVDDGLALSFDSDRSTPGRSVNKPANPTAYPPAEPMPMFAEPMADLWRELMFHLIFDAADDQQLPLGWLHYWPAGVPAIAHLSHDSDQNQDAHARVALDVFADAGVAVTWCQCWPGGYSTETVRAITAQGHEQALHYNALDSHDGMPWGLEGMREQHAWATKLTGAEIVTNKNHYTRWENWSEFYGWCQELGIQIDESRGPSKPGTVGFPYGTCHLGFPIDETGRRYDVLALPLHSQDLVWAAHESVGPVILDRAAGQHGVAHILFHGTNLSRSEEIRTSVGRLVRAARQRGLPWWTAARINAFERARRGVSVRITQAGDGLQVTLTAVRPLRGAGLVVPLPSGSEPAPWIARTPSDGRSLPSAVVIRHGRAFGEITLDLPAGVTDVDLRAPST